jgi:hypothetical protein
MALSVELAVGKATTETAYVMVMPRKLEDNLFRQY